MGDEFLFVTEDFSKRVSTLPPISLVRKVQKTATLVHEGYRFTIDIARVGEILKRLVLQFENTAHRESILARISFIDLSKIQILKEIVLERRGVWGTEMIHVCSGIYYLTRQEVQISASSILDCMDCELKGSRFKRFNFQPPKKWFAYILAHELRHWLQESIDPKVDNRKTKLKKKALSSISRILSFVLGPRGLYYLVAMIFGVISVILFWNGLVALAYASLFCGILFSVSTLLIAKKPNYLFSLKSKLDLFINGTQYYLDYDEIDSHEFGLFAIQNEEWLKLVRIEEVN